MKKLICLSCILPYHREQYVSVTAKLQTVKDFPDYLDYLPKGSMMRKIRVMGQAREAYEGENDPLFFPREELDGYIERTCTAIVHYIGSK